MFDENVQTKEFDMNRPISLDARRVKDFIKHNKKKIRSRSKNMQLEQSMRKKTALKRGDLICDQDREFYEVDDQGIQTSFIVEDQSQQTYMNKTSKLTLALSQGCTTQTNTLCSPKDDDLKENNNPLDFSQTNEYQA